jgi:hypothetical protein
MHGRSKIVIGRGRRQRAPFASAASPAAPSRPIVRLSTMRPSGSAVI